jgi:hypothetical protein
MINLDVFSGHRRSALVGRRLVLASKQYEFFPGRRTAVSNTLYFLSKDETISGSALDLVTQFNILWPGQMAALV